MELVNFKCIGCDRVYRSLKKSPQRFCSKECVYFYHSSRKDHANYKEFLDKIRKPQMLPSKGDKNV